MNKLPDKYSDLIELAIKDIQLCKKDKRYKIDMSLWHFYNPAQRVCFVCLSGSMLAKTLECPYQTEREEIYGGNSQKLNFINNLRYGEVRNDSILFLVGVKSLWYLKTHPILKYPTRKQFGALRTIARELRERGH